MPNYLDLFAGAGGLSEGFVRAGYEPVAHVEMDVAACYSLKTRVAYHWLKKNNKLNIYSRYLNGEISRSEFYEEIPKSVLNTVLNYEISEAVIIIAKLALVMAGLALLELFCNYFISYQGHVMGAKMEFDMRNDIFHHFQKLSFSFYDNQKTGQLMSRITNDLFEVTELSHHGPEDIVISITKFVGAFIILIRINVPLTLLLFLFLPIMFLFAWKMKTRMNKAFKANRERIADINAQIEDNLSGIRVVKSFANEDMEVDKFREGNSRFVASKKLGQGRKRVGLPLIADGLIIHDRAFDLRVIAVFYLLAGLDIAQGEAERGQALFVFGIDLLGGFLCLPLGLVHSNPFQLVRAAVDLRNGLQNGIGILRRHSVKLTHALLPVETLDGTQVGIQLVDDAMDLQIR